MEPQIRYSEKELKMMKSMFGGDNGLKNLKLLSKVFLPKYDYDAPIGQTVDSLWMGLEQLSSMTPQDREMAIMTQIRINNHLEKQLMTLQYFANEKEESKEEKAKRLKADSAK